MPYVGSAEIKFVSACQAQCVVQTRSIAFTLFAMDATGLGMQCLPGQEPEPAFDSGDCTVPMSGVEPSSGLNATPDETEDPQVSQALATFEQVLHEILSRMEICPLCGYDSQEHPCVYVPKTLSSC